MKLTLALLLASTVLCSDLHAESPVPAVVFVGTEEAGPKDFAVRAETDPAKYSGTYSGDVGGDSTGSLVVKVGKPKDGATSVSGTYKLTPAGQALTVVKFENAIYYGDPKGVVSVGPFDLVFVRHGKTEGVIVGNVFLQKD